MATNGIARDVETTVIAALGITGTPVRRFGDIASDMTGQQVIVKAEVSQVAPGYPHYWAKVFIFVLAHMAGDKNQAKIDALIKTVEDFVFGVTVASIAASATGIVVEGVVPMEVDDQPTPFDDTYNVKQQGVKFALRKAS